MRVTNGYVLFSLNTNDVLVFFVGTMAEAENKPTAEEDLHEDDPNYRAPAQKSVKEIVEADQEDESLRKYKESLLGGAIKEVKPPCECRNSSMFELSIVHFRKNKRFSFLLFNFDKLVLCNR